MGKKSTPEEQVLEIAETGMIAGTAEHLIALLKKTTLLTQEEKEPSLTAIRELRPLLAMRTRPAYRALTAKIGRPSNVKGNVS